VETPKVGAYNLDYYDINKTVSKVLNEPPEIKESRAPFNSKAERFKPVQEVATIVGLG
jgi:hypothetical protein